MTENNQEIHPELLKILEYPITEKKINREYLPLHLLEKETIVIGDLIEKTDIRFDKVTGKPMMVHSGVLDIIDKIGAEFIKPELTRDESRDEHTNLVGIRFADGRIFFATGEASPRNVNEKELTGKFPVNQAHIRAINKALVRGLGLYRVLLTEEESEDFKQPAAVKVKQEYEDKLKAMHQQWQQREQGLLRIIDGMLDYASLPSEDLKYPNVRIIDVYKKHQDKEYLQSLLTSTDQKLAFITSQIIKRIDKEELNSKKTTQVEQESEIKVKELSEEEKLKLELNQFEEEINNKKNQTKKTTKKREQTDIKESTNQILNETVEKETTEINS